MNKYLFFIFVSIHTLSAQKVSVQRCSDIDRKVPIVNIHIDDQGNKWIADQKGLFLAQSPQFAKVVEFPSKEWSLLTVPDGNAEIKLSKSELQGIIGEEVKEITTAHYVAKTKELWIGTTFNGVFQLKLQPNLNLIKHHLRSNSKLRTDVIQCIQSSVDGTVYIGTEDGLMVFEDGKTDLIGKYFSINSIDFLGRKPWILSDGEIYEVDEKGDFLPFDVPEKMLDGQIIDFAYDKYGQMWIASDVIVLYDITGERYDLYGPAQDFTSQNVNRIATDNEDGLWVGTSDKGVYYIGTSSTLSATIVLEKSLSCGADASDAALTVRASGGQPPYAYTWTGEATGESPENLGPGAYSVTVTDQKGEQAQALYEIEDTRIELDISQVSPASPGGSDGKAAVEVTNSKAVFTYKWDNGENKRRANQLSPGTHFVTVTSPNGCATLDSIEIEESLAPLSVTLNQLQPIKCHGQQEASLEVIVKGGQAPYTFNWQGIENNEALVKNLPAGNYQILVTDASGEQREASLQIEQPTVLEATARVLQSASTNKSDGQAEAAANGGQAPYTYKWSNGATNQKVNNLAAGNHAVTITDNNGCATESNLVITEDILPLSVELKQLTDLLCSDANNASLEVQISGGKAPFVYQWSFDTEQTTKALNLSAGSYQVTVTDAANNSKMASWEVKAPKPLTASISGIQAANIDQTDGKAELEVAGGTGKYTYLWDNGEKERNAKSLNAGKHTVTITDKNGCTLTQEVDITEDIKPLVISLQQNLEINCAEDETAAISVQVEGGKAPFSYQWNKNGASGAQISNIGAGTYEVTVTDQTNQTASKTITLNAPQALQATISAIAPASTNNSDGQALVTVNGGNKPYSYNWDTGETKAEATQLKAGNHSVTITDTKGCSLTQTIAISENILPLQVILNQQESIRCKGGNEGILEVSASGGRAPYNYTWSETAAKGTTISNLTAGTYTVTVTDSDGSTQIAETKLTEPAPLIVSLQSNRPATYEDSEDGRAVLTTSGGTPGYTYTWDNGETGNEARKLSVGEHVVNIQDANNCKTALNLVTKKRINPEITASTLRPGQKLQVSQLFFDADSTEAKPESYPALDEIADFLKENTAIKIEVGGHTNNVPPADYCDQLSTARAKSVATYLVEQGIPDDRVFYRGYGKREPKYSNRTEDGRRRNQRVEIKVLEVGGG